MLQCVCPLKESNNTVTETPTFAVASGSLPLWVAASDQTELLSLPIALSGNLSGAEAEALSGKLSKARETVVKLEKEHSAKVALAAQAKEMKEAKRNLLTDLTKLHSAKQTKVDSLSLSVAAQKEKVAHADEMANPLNHPLVKKYFS